MDISEAHPRDGEDPGEIGSGYPPPSRIVKNRTRRLGPGSAPSDQPWQSRRRRTNERTFGTPEGLLLDRFAAPITRATWPIIRIGIF